jgi:hypothetical protein
MFDHGVENREQLAHAGDQSDFERFALGLEPFVEISNHGIVSSSDQGCHVQSAAHRSSATPDATAAFKRATVAVEGSQTHQRRNLFTIEGAEFWQLGQQGAAGDWADCRSTAQNIFVLFPDRALFDEAIDIGVDTLEFLFELTDVLGDIFGDCFGSRDEVVFLHDDHLDELSSARAQRSEFQSDRVGQRPQLGSDCLGVMSQYRCIDAVGFGQLSGGFSEVSDLAWIGPDHSDLGADQSADELTFKAAGGFQHDQGRLDLRQSFDQRLDTGFVIGHRQGLSSGTNCDIELCFGHIDADKDKGILQYEILLDDFNRLQPSSTLRMMRAWITQATVRAFGEQERDDPCYKTVSNDRGANGLSHPFRINIFHRAMLN